MAKSEPDSEAESREPSCSLLRNTYNDCFNRWYSDKYLKGERHQIECIAEWEAYKICVLKYAEDKKLSHLLQEESKLSSEKEHLSHRLFPKTATE